MMKNKLLFLATLIMFSVFGAHANIYLVTSNADVGAGTLREAITFANSHPGADAIQFALLDTSVAGRTITLTSILGQVTDQLIIDGTTQAGAPFGVSQAKIQITATTPLTQGLYLVADSCEVYGLFMQNFGNAILITSAHDQIGAIGKGNVIFNCTNACIDISETDHVSIVGNLLGLDTAQLVGSNSSIGVHVEHSTGVAIGGKSSDGRNIISGNIYGVKLENSKFVDMNSNHIGTDLDGLAAIPNQWGIYANGDNSNIEVGGDSVYEQNLISGNINAAIYGKFVGTIIQGNFIGTDVTGKGPLGNGTYGIYLLSGSNTINVGGKFDHQLNIIAFNGNEAIYFEDSTCTQISIIRNLTSCNSQISGNGGFTFNGGNNNVPPPTILIANQYGATGITSPGARVDVFFDDTCSHCEGDSLVGSVYAEASGVWDIEKDMSGTITATMTDTSGNSSDYTPCTLVGNPTCILADFVTPQQGSCANVALQFTDLSVTAPGTAFSTWAWNFGDGNTSTDQNPLHTYSAGGDYTVTLTVMNSQECESSISKSYSVANVPVAAFASSLPACVGTDINFTDQSTVAEGDSIISWHWDFGDGGTSDEQNPSHSFISSGTYVITLSISGLSCTDSINEAIQIYNLPTANFTAPLQVCKASDFGFTDLSTAGEGDQLVSWLWDFGDGSLSEVQNPDHVYLEAGTYTVTLTVTGTSGCSDEFSGTIEVIDFPTALFSSAELICVGNEISFTDQSTTGGDDITSWSWDFGDGNSSTEQNPSNIYNQAGFYSVSLSIQTSAGCTAEYSSSVTVADAPSTVFASPAQSCVGNEVNFSDQSTAGEGDAVSTWNWDFGDGNSSPDQNPVYAYGSPGIYDVMLLINTSAGCNGQYDTVIQILNQPVASFSYIQTGLTVTFSSTSSDNGHASYTWDFGDGNTSGEENPVHQYTSGGVYNVCLTVYDSTCMTSSNFCSTVDLPTGIINSAVDAISIYPNPASDEIIIAGLPAAGIDKISVLNSIGQRILQLDATENSPLMKMNVQSFPQGVYIIQLQKSGAMVMEKKIHVIH